MAWIEAWGCVSFRCGLMLGGYSGEVDGDGGELGRRGRTSDSPADQRRSMSVNVRGAARTWMEVVRERRVKVVVRKCIFRSFVVWLGL